MDRYRAEELLGAACTRFGVPGAQLGLQRGSERFVVCAGSKEVRRPSEPVEHSTRFHLGSITKSLTAMVVLEAAKRGALDLDAPCSAQAEGLWSDTPRTLLAQTSGRPNVLPEFDEDLESFVTRVGDMPRLHPPGGFSYCNPGWVALDLLLRRTTGRTFEELASDLLGWRLTFGAPSDATSGHSVLPDGAPIPVPEVLPEVASAAGTRWWASADELLDYAHVHLDPTAAVGSLRGPDLAAMRRPHAIFPGATVADTWGLGWALWDRGAHKAFGWSGYVIGHRAYLRCFGDDATLVVLTNSAGPLLGPLGGNALFDALLPAALELLGAPPLEDVSRHESAPPTSKLAGQYGPVVVDALGDELVVRAEQFGNPEPIRYGRLGGSTFAPVDGRPGGFQIAFDQGLLYVGPMAFAADP